MSTSYAMEKYQPPKNQAPSKVRRFPLYRRPGPKPAPSAPPAPAEPPKEEKPAPPPPAPVWSNWQFIKEPLWEGYWRASAQEDGGWHYQLTKDGKTIWEQKVPKPEAPKPSTATAKTEGEQVLSGEIPATAFTTTALPVLLQARRALSRATTMTAADNDMHYYPTPFNDTIHSSLLPPKLRALILRGHSSSSNSNSQISTTTRAQKASSTSYHYHRSKEQRQDRSLGTRNSSSTKDREVISSNDHHHHRDNDRKRSVVYSEEARTSQAASAAQEGHWDDYASHKKRQGRHGASPRSREARRYQNTIGEVVSAEKQKKFDAKRIVDSWQWG